MYIYRRWVRIHDQKLNYFRKDKGVFRELVERLQHRSLFAYSSLWAEFSIEMLLFRQGRVCGPDHLFILVILFIKRLLTREYIPSNFFSFLRRNFSVTCTVLRKI